MFDILKTCAAAVEAADGLIEKARAVVAGRVVAEGRIDTTALETHQYAAHGLAWMATYGAALREMLAWARRLQEADALGELEILILHATFGEYLAQMHGGLAMSQVEIVRPADLGLSADDVAAFLTDDVKQLIDARKQGVLDVKLWLLVPCSL